MNFEQAQTEVYARGFSFLSQDAAGQLRVQRWINQAYLNLCEMFPWPFLEDTESGSAPLAMPDMRAVLSVTNTVQRNKLRYVDRRTLTDYTSDLTIPGSPSVYYFEDQSLAVYPVNTDILDVRYLKVPVELTGNTDPFLVPSRFHDLIVDLSVLRAAKDSHQWETVNALRKETDRAIMEMAASLMIRNHGEPDVMVTTDPEAWA